MRATNRLLTICLCGASLLAVSAAYAADTTDLGTVSVTGAGEVLGGGNLVVETASKGRSTVTAAGIANLLPTNNPYQALNLLPGVSQNNYDPTGLFGGNITVRGLRADQLGFTINGAPVNDSGNYAVYPQEYVDPENLDQIWLTQGSTDVDSPHVGATGGNIGIVSRPPSDKFAVMGQFTTGDFNLDRGFARLDTGYIGPVKMFVSYSHTSVDKWKGLGGDKRDHIDGQVFYKIGKASQIVFNVLYNTAVIDQPGTETLAQFQANGPKYESGFQYTNPTLTSYYAYKSINPFKNAVVNLKFNLQLMSNLRFDFEPYYWYGWGGGGTSASTQTNGNFDHTASGVFDALNPEWYTWGNLPAANTLLYRSSVTRTKRPGFTSKFTYDIDNWTLQLGGWYEKANHRQTQPYSFISPGGKVCDIWLTSTDNNPCVARTAGGAVIQGRDQLTISQGSSLFFNAVGKFFDDALKVNLGVSYRQLNRQGFDYLPIPVLIPGSLCYNNGGAIPATSCYNPFAAAPHVNYSKLLPNIGMTYDFDDENQLFADLAKNFKAPANYVLFAYDSWGSNFLSTNTAFLPETDWTYEAGYRYHGPLFTTSLTGFYNDISNYQATALIDPTDTSSTANVNIGGVKIYGLEAEAGTNPWHGFTLYGSFTYQHSELENNVPVKVIGGVIQHLATAGKRLTDTPDYLGSLQVGYQNDGWFASLAGKYNGSRAGTLINDQTLPSFWTADFTAGYQFNEAIGALHGAKLQFFVSNLFDKTYLGAISSTSANNALNQTSIEGQVLTGSAPSYYAGPPRFFGVSLRADFD